MIRRRKQLAGKTGKTALRYLILLVLLESTVAGVLPNRRWMSILSSSRSLVKPKPAVDFTIRIRNGKSVVDQDIHIDMTKQTESYHVFPFDDVDESVILHDFTKNWTLIRLPQKHQCFIQPLSSETQPPQELKSSIQKAIAMNGTNTTADIAMLQSSKWQVTNILFNRQLLTNKMKKMCVNDPVYEISKISGLLSIKGAKRIGRSPQHQRNACGGRVCNIVFKWVFRCISGKGCFWVKFRIKRCQNIQC